MLTINFKTSARLCLLLALSLFSGTTLALPVDRAPAIAVFAADADAALVPTQSNCASLNDAVERIRRQGNVKQVLSADTRVSRGREVHYIKVLTKDGKVRTHTVNGCKR